jgi:hypothetical protein
MKTSIRACEQDMRKRKLELGVGRGERRGKGEEIAGFGVAPCGRAMG